MRARIGYVVALVALLSVPWVMGPYAVATVSKILVFAVLAMSVNLLTGVSGLPTLGQSAYFGVGAYAGALTAIHLTDVGPAQVVIAALAGAVAAAVTGTLSVYERTREIGLLRAAGTTGRQVLGLFARQGLLFGLAGAALGILLGIGLAAAMIGFLRSTRAVLVDGLPVSLPVVLVAAGLGIGVTVVASAVPALAAARTGPLDALRPSRRPGATLSAPLRWLVLLELGVVLLGIVVYPFDRGSSALPAIVLALALLVGGALAAYGGVAMVSGAARPGELGAALRRR